MSVAGSAPLHSEIQTNPHPSVATPFAEPTTGTTGTVTAPATEDDASGKKHKKRHLFGFGKKKTDESSHLKSPPAQTSTPTTAPAASTAGTSNRGQPSRRTTASPIRIDKAQQGATTTTTTTGTTTTTARLPPSSPGRALSSSPRLSPRLGSPAGSQIFERDVQESAATLPNSPGVPSHIATENYIPPVLDASSEAITDDRIDPDSVEIITHLSHQPAASSVLPHGGGGGGVPMTTSGNQSSSSFYDHSMAASWAAELASFEHDGPLPGPTDSASNYGSLQDTTDVRRLSFISFADVVQGEQHPTNGGGGNAAASSSRDSMHIAGLTSLPTLGVHNRNRSPSPIRSPVSSQGEVLPGTSPPTSKSGSVRGFETSGSPSRKGTGLGPGGPHPPHTEGELKVETMSQALRRTGSADLSGVRSVPTSPIEGPSR